MAEIRLAPMTHAQYLGYRETAEELYAKHVAGSGEMAWEAAVEKAAADYQRLLPDGLQTPDHHMFRAYSSSTGGDGSAEADGDSDVGMIWVKIAPDAEGLKAWIYDIAVEERERRHGYGRAIMRAAEDFCRSRGVISIGLNVHGNNVGARALYEQEGYTLTTLQMRKLL